MPPAAWPRFLKTHGLTLSALLVATALLNVVVNPLALYPTHVFRAEFWDTRGMKIDLLDRASPQTLGALIVGSSRAMKLRPATVERATGLKTFNAAVGGAVIEDDYALLRYAVEHSGVRPRLLIVGLELETFDTSEYDPNNVHPALLEYLGKTQFWYEWRRLTSLVTIQQTRLSLRTLTLAMTQPDRRADRYFERDGYVQWDGWAAERRRDPRFLQGKITEQAATYASSYRRLTQLSPARIALLGGMLRYCRERHVAVTLVLTPMHPALADRLATTNYPRLQADLAARVHAVAEQSGATVADFTALDSFGGRRDAFYDGVHIDDDNGDRLTRSVVQALRALQ